MPADLAPFPRLLSTEEPEFLSVSILRPLSFRIQTLETSIPLPPSLKSLKRQSNPRGRQKDRQTRRWVGSQLMAFHSRQSNRQRQRTDCEQSIDEVDGITALRLRQHSRRSCFNGTDLSSRDVMHQHRLPPK